MQHEEREQIAIIQWATYMENRYPELRLLHHIPNGGKRDPLTAQLLKASGVKPGIPDLHLPVARNGYHGLWIELKYGSNKPTVLQRQMIDLLNEQGNRAVVCYGADDAIREIESYLKGDAGNDERGND